MLEVLNKTENETKLDTVGKREAIEAELRSDPTRSDREIGRVCKVDHKTVGAARERLGISPVGNLEPTPSERRHMLIEGCKEFDRHFPPETAEEAVDSAIAKGVVSLSPDCEHLVQAAVDQCKGAAARIREERQAKAAAEDEANGEQTVLRSQREVTIQFDDGTGEWVLKQKNWPDDDGEIRINEEHVTTFLNALCDRLGVGSAR